MATELEKAGFYEDAAASLAKAIVAKSKAWEAQETVESRKVWGKFIGTCASIATIATQQIYERARDQYEREISEKTNCSDEKSVQQEDKEDKEESSEDVENQSNSKDNFSKAILLQTIPYGVKALEALYQIFIHWKQYEAYDLAPNPALLDYLISANSFNNEIKSKDKDLTHVNKILKELGKNNYAVVMAEVIDQSSKSWSSKKNVAKWRIFLDFISTICKDGGAAYGKWIEKQEFNGVDKYDTLYNYSIMIEGIGAISDFVSSLNEYRQYEAENIAPNPALQNFLTSVALQNYTCFNEIKEEFQKKPESEPQKKPESEPQKKEGLELQNIEAKPNSDPKAGNTDELLKKKKGNRK